MFFFSKSSISKITIVCMCFLCINYCDILSFLFFSQGFLVESKLLKLLSHLEKNEQSLIKLDAIFSVCTIIPVINYFNLVILT